uniref:Uncharacterized protein n=1 Tax=Rhizophora mucronata TaxID=61149 RepID=A0A2P2NAV4_RHIMU
MRLEAHIGSMNFNARLIWIWTLSP